ncbi:sugar transferase [Paenibacillus taiwanensis]|uniref:sugar transferase n=1 Tax=Paenibacillus taiwanensis TaxID=401638 RepID=UPI0024804E56|nr:sugar transferase [Paenibacillus taiwanensis]
MEMKRSFDVTAASILLLLLSPIMLLTALFVRIRIGNPIWFLQERPGKEMKSFQLYKFRTMTDARDSNGELLPDESRLTKAGIFLRRLSLDELPQLINVLKGDMSLVGPRPLLVKYNPYYTSRELIRFQVRPGITGLAQISGRNMLSWEERFELDAYYVEHWSFLVDVRILWMTVIQVFARKDVAIYPSQAVMDLDKERQMLM